MKPPDIKSAFLKSFALTEQYRLLRRIHPFFLIILGAAVLIWCQVNIYLQKDGLTRDFGRLETIGLDHPVAKQFVYFFHFLNIFPLATTAQSAEMSVEGALSVIKNQPGTLRMEIDHWMRYGNWSRILTYLPHLWINSRAVLDPSPRPFNILVLAITLTAILAVCARAELPLFGLMAALLVGSSPSILFETYLRDNIFALISCTGILLLMLNMGMLNAAHFRRRHQMIAFLSGILVAFSSDIRSEILATIAIPFGLYIFAGAIPLRLRLGLCIILSLGYISATVLSRAYFDSHYWITEQLVRAANGPVYTGLKVRSHTLWHPIFCGLGDFDKSHGYRWLDLVAYSYAIPILRERYASTPRYDGRYRLPEYYDSDLTYYRKFEEIPQYEAVIREKVLSDIRADPLWYLEILARRANRILSMTTPVKLHLPGFRGTLPGNGWILIPLALLFLAFRQWFWLKLSLALLPVAGSNMLVYSGSNATYANVFHLFLYAFLICWLLELALIAYISWKGATRGSSFLT